MKKNIKKIELWQNGDGQELYNLTIWGTDGNASDICSGFLDDLIEELPAIIAELSTADSFTAWLSNNEAR